MRFADSFYLVLSKTKPGSSEFQFLVANVRNMGVATLPKQQVKSKTD